MMGLITLLAAAAAWARTLAWPLLAAAAGATVCFLAAQASTGRFQVAALFGGIALIGAATWWGLLRVRRRLQYDRPGAALDGESEPF